MEEIRKIDNEAYEWLIVAGPKHWSRSHFSTNPKCDILLNNMCGAFNGTKSILAARDRPILSMLERLRMYLMQRMTKNRQTANTWNSNLAPKIVTILEKIKVEDGSHLPTKSGDLIYQIQTMYGFMYSVDLKTWVCSCRKWELTGIPCSHAVAAIWHNKQDPELYAKKNPPKDPGTYTRNHNPMSHDSVSLTTQKTSAQETTQQFQNRSQAKQSIRMKPANKQDKGGNILRKKVRVASMKNYP
ncbi:uncharacterized protein LOC133784994 [Humulus lupulus]|uniref:uncharacterized protein LOC133784994 n=1 Tax=Humulus lupulus TaxID=3486 RepID=UPI002B417F4B|nr:uncharacterized protein LOC133784994 [Humulus lupulus]